MHPHDPRPAPWWMARPALMRFVADLVAAELAALRHDPLMRAEGWTGDLSLDDDLAVDSLELMQVAGSLAGALQMHRSGIEDYLLARRTLGDWVDIAAAALEQHDAELTFSSSGSSGQPKRCSHALALLEQEAQALAALFTGRRRLLVGVPSHHIYGFICTQLMPRHLGLAPEQVIGIRTRLPAALGHFAQPGDLVVGHPQFWQAALAPGHAFPEDVVGVTSTAPCPDGVAQAAQEAGLALFQLYGASETAGLGWRASHREDYRLHPYLVRDQVQGNSVRRILPDGRAEVLQAQDLLVWSGERSFAVGQRRDGAVQVGGVNVYPERVREVLLTHPGIEDAAVRLMRPGEGVRLKAFVVRRPDAGGSEREFLAGLRAWIDAHLASAERPKAITFGSALPRNALGKNADWEIE